MDISRSTVQEIYKSARRKIAACLVHGKKLVITDGNYRICDGQEIPQCGRCCSIMFCASKSPLLPVCETFGFARTKAHPLRSFFDSLC